MERVRSLFNIIHYCLYRFDNRLHLLSNKLNPALLIGKIPIFKKKFEEQGITQEEAVNKAWSDKRYGLGIMLSGGILTITVFFLIWGLLLPLNSFFANPIPFSWMPFVICLSLAYLICHVLVFHKDQYLRYFSHYDNWPKQTRWKYGFISILIVGLAFALFINSFSFLPKPPR